MRMNLIIDSIDIIDCMKQYKPWKIISIYFICMFLLCINIFSAKYAIIRTNDNIRALMSPKNKLYTYLLKSTRKFTTTNKNKYKS